MELLVVNITPPGTPPPVGPPPWNRLLVEVITVVGVLVIGGGGVAPTLAIAAFIASAFILPGF